MLLVQVVSPVIIVELCGSPMYRKQTLFPFLNFPIATIKQFSSNHTQLSTKTLWQWSEGSKLHRSNWMHCLTYLDYSNSITSNTKSHAKRDVKNTGRLAHLTINLVTDYQ